MPKHLCAEYVPGRFGVRLWQTGFDRFTVEYGLQVKRGLDYAQAASELGACLMHALACEGYLDNRTREEARAAGDRTIYVEPKT